MVREALPGYEVGAELGRGAFGVVYDNKGVVKLGDFGIARLLDTSARRTATGMVIGTPAYIPLRPAALGCVRSP